jgi:hypothetical protein
MNEDLDYRKIKNYLRKHSSTSGDDYQLRLSLLRLFYYTLEGYQYPIAKLKSESEINYDMYPYFFKNKNRMEIIDIYNKEIKSNSLIKIFTEDELNDYDINENVCLEISLKTFRPIYKENWKEISEEVNKVPFNKQKSFYADYLRCYLKLRYFPTLDEFMKYVYYKYKMPIHKDIKIVYNNIEKSYKEVKEYIKRNNMSFDEVRKILINSTSILNRIVIQ